MKRERSGAARPGARRPIPERSEEFDHLALDELRAYRRQLSEEESRVSYWRRLIQARLDIIRAGAGSGATPDAAALRRLLSREQLRRRHETFVEVGSGEDLPALPNLSELWERDLTAGDIDIPLLLADLSAAERQLSDYRRRLHRRIDDATAELVARYRERPALAMRALPLRAPVRRRHGG